MASTSSTAQVVSAAAWQPVLDSRLADQARALVRDIAGEIAQAPAALHQPDDSALFWAYAAAFLDDERSDGAYDRATRAVIARVEENRPGPLRLYGGLAGAGWTLAHIGDGDGDELLSIVDRALLDALSVDRWEADYDLIGGLTGYGMYFLERLSSGREAPEASSGLHLVVAHLDALAERGSDGVTWHTSPALLPPWQRELWPGGYYNLGVAHGVPGVVAMLARTVALPDPPRHARELHAGAIRWTRARELSGDPRGRFPASIAPRETSPERGPTAWCYGDPGVAAALWSATVRTGGDPGEWSELAADAAARTAGSCHLVDPGLCHGAFGLAHLYNRCYQASRDLRFQTASRTWFERGLAMRRPGEGAAGFVTRSWDPATRQTSWVAAHGFLEGVAGIGLALIAGLTGEEPAWDRLLLCDIPTAAR